MLRILFLFELIIVVLGFVHSLPVNNNEKSSHQNAIGENTVNRFDGPAGAMSRHNDDEDDEEQQQQHHDAALLERFFNRYPESGSRVGQQEESDDDDGYMQSNGAGTNSFSRQRRRLSVFKNIYKQCRTQKRADQNLCLYLANLYQNVKGYHGL